MATQLISVARRASAAERLAAMPRLERASAVLAGAAKALLAALDDGGAWLDADAAWSAVERVAPREDVLGAVAVVEELVPDDSAEDAAMREALTVRYGVVRPFLELLAEALPLGAAPAGEKLLAEVRRLAELARRRAKARHLGRDQVAAALVPAAWQRAVYRNPGLPADAADRDAYVLCILEQLHRALRRRDIFASPSVRWADPRAQLLDGEGWHGVRGEVLAGLGLTGTAGQHLAGLTQELDAAWRLLAGRMAEAGTGAPVRLVPEDDGRIRLAVDRLDAVGEPESLTRLRDTVTAMLPRVDLSDLLLEVHGWTGFLQEYTHVGERGPRMDGLPVSVAALLVAEACNVGLTPVTDPNSPALTRGRLSHVDHNYLRADTHSAANARLVDAQASIGVAQLWGGGLVASADGLRFVVPVQTVNALPSPRYFGRGRGVTWLNADQRPGRRDRRGGVAGHDAGLAALGESDLWGDRDKPVAPRRAHGQLGDGGLAKVADVQRDPDATGALQGTHQTFAMVSTGTITCSFSRAMGDRWPWRFTSSRYLSLMRPRLRCGTPRRSGITSWSSSSSAFP
jgi:Tn3 transposase DDE domain